MNDKSIEIMKKIIEEKKQKNNNNKNNQRAKKVIGKHSKGVKVGNGGGLFDK
ncbi:hypothetical protein [Clostridium beijerinckii]|uniref:hypothetical protein n=1 Tax=Clostridium beijerinckii TaxID=1520 RepID=UPI001F161786|nr:hypothetical protein [Clostridium beijerinckii]